MFKIHAEIVRTLLCIGFLRWRPKKNCIYKQQRPGSSNHRWVSKVHWNPETFLNAQIAILRELRMSIPRARITAPAVHACLFVVAYAYWLLFERNTHSPGRLDLASILWIADLPVSVLASFMTLGIGFVAGIGRAQVAFAFILWAVLGTIWWYFLGIYIEVWIRRFSRKAETVRGSNS